MFLKYWKCPVRGNLTDKEAVEAADRQSRSEMNIMCVRAALALFGMGSMRAHEADLISLDPLSNK